MKIAKVIQWRILDARYWAIKRKIKLYESLAGHADSLKDKIGIYKLQAEKYRERKELEPILYEVCEMFGLPVSEVISGNRGRETTAARQVYYRRAREVTSLTYSAIGRITNRNYGTAIYGERQAYDVKEIDDKYRMIYDSRRSKND